MRTFLSTSYRMKFSPSKSPNGVPELVSGSVAKFLSDTHFRAAATASSVVSAAISGRFSLSGTLLAVSWRRHAGRPGHRVDGVKRNATRLTPRVENSMDSTPALGEVDTGNIVDELMNDTLGHAGKCAGLAIRSAREAWEADRAYLTRRCGLTCEYLRGCRTSGRGCLFVIASGFGLCRAGAATVSVTAGGLSRRLKVD